MYFGAANYAASIKSLNIEELIKYEKIVNITCHFILCLND